MWELGITSAGSSKEQAHCSIQGGIALLRADMHAMKQSVNQSISQIYHQYFRSSIDPESSPTINNVETGDSVIGKRNTYQFPPQKSNTLQSKDLISSRKNLKTEVLKLKRNTAELCKRAVFDLEIKKKRSHRYRKAPKVNISQANSRLWTFPLTNLTADIYEY